MRARAGAKIATFPLVAGVALSVLVGCTPSTAAGGTPDHVVVLTTATSHEPRPMLTDQALQILRDAAESKTATDGAGGKNSSALVTIADGRFGPPLPLTPRRSDGEVEHGLQRDALIKDNLRKVEEAVSATTATQPGVDLLQGIDDAVAGSDHGVLILVSNGLSTSGGFDLRQVGWNADPGQIAAQLRDRDLLPDLTGWRVLFTGLGATAGDQPPLTTPARDKLTAYWKAICAAAAGDCRFDGTRFTPVPPDTTVQTPVVAIPEVSSVTGPSGEVTTTLSDRVLGFAGDSSMLPPTALDLLHDTADRINADLTAHPDTQVTVRGYTADPPGSTPGDRQRLSQDRAQAVADALTAAGVAHRIQVFGGATAPGLTSVVNGTFDEAIAVRMRRVEITY